MKQCAFCNEQKEAELFYVNSRSNDGRTSYCKKCLDLKKKEWLEKNRCRHLEYRRMYEKYKRDKFKKKANNSFQKAKRKILCDTTDITSDFLSKLKETVGDTCPYCLKCNIDKWELDHIIPLSKEGTHSQDNVMWCCRTCNRKKYNKLLSEVNLLVV